MDRLQLTQANFDITPAIIKSLQEGYVPRQSYIDVRLSTEAIQHLEIMMGPSTSEADRFIVETLVEKLRYAKVENSFFKGIIKER